MSSLENQQNKINILFYYSMHKFSGITAFLEQPIFFKVNLLALRDTRLRAPLNLQQKHSTGSVLHKVNRPGSVEIQLRAFQPQQL